MPHPVTRSPVLVAALARIRCVPREQVMRIVVVLFLIAAILG